MMTRILPVNLYVIVLTLMPKYGPDLSDSCINSDDGQVSENIGGNDDDGGGGGCGYNNKDDNNEDWALWDKKNQDFYMIPFHASAGYKPPRSRQMPVSSDKFFMLYFNANLFEEIAAETNICNLKTGIT
jgi:hypothetical protein